MHPRTTPESRSLAFTWPPYVNVHFNLILPRRPCEAAYLAGAIASHVSGLSVIMSKSTDAKKKYIFALGQTASSHFPLVRTDKCNLSIMNSITTVVYTVAVNKKFTFQFHC